MKNLQFIVFILTFLLVISCKNNSTSLTIINAESDSYNEISININEYIEDNIKIIPLETNDSCLVPGSCNIYPGNKYIYFYSIDRILQFDYQGDFIRNISRKGSGPGEILSISDCTVDSKDQFLYCVQMDDKDNIMVFDILTGNFLKTIPNAIRSPLVAINLLNDTTLICFPQRSSFSLSNTLAFIQNNKGDLKSTITRNSPIKEGLVMRKRPSILNYSKDIIYLPNSSDTLYRIANYSSALPIICIKTTEEEKYKRDNSGYMFNGKSLIISNIDNELKNIGGGNIIMEPIKERYYLVDLVKQDIRIVNKVEFSALGVSFSKENLSVFFNNISFIKKGYMTLTINDEIMNSSIENIASINVKEGCNPTIIIAKLKE